MITGKRYLKKNQNCKFTTTFNFYWICNMNAQRKGTKLAIYLKLNFYRQIKEKKKIDVFTVTEWSNIYRVRPLWNSELWTENTPKWINILVRADWERKRKSRGNKYTAISFTIFFFFSVKNVKKVSGKRFVKLKKKINTFQRVFSKSRPGVYDYFIFASYLLQFLNPSFVKGKLFFWK